VSDLNSTANAVVIESLQLFYQYFTVQKTWVMPVIVDEVVISVEVSNKAAGGSASTTSATQDKQTIISECIERVLDILEQKAER
jgi:hypothetical protein